MKNFVSRLVVGAAIVALLASTATAGPTGLVWVPDRGDYLMTQMEGDTWVQTDPNGKVLAVFVQFESNKDFVVFGTKTKTYLYKVYNGISLQRTPGNPRWVPGDPGKFERR